MLLLRVKRRGICVGGRMGVALSDYSEEICMMKYNEIMVTKECDGRYVRII